MPRMREAEAALHQLQVATPAAGSVATGRGEWRSKSRARAGSARRAEVDARQGMEQAQEAEKVVMLLVGNRARSARRWKSPGESGDPQSRAGTGGREGQLGEDRDRLELLGTRRRATSSCAIRGARQYAGDRQGWRQPRTGGAGRREESRRLQGRQAVQCIADALRISHSLRQSPSRQHRCTACKLPDRSRSSRCRNCVRT